MVSVTKKQPTNKGSKPAHGQARVPKPPESAPVGPIAPAEEPASPVQVAAVAPQTSVLTPSMVETDPVPVVAAPVVAELPIASIRHDGGTQSRAQLSSQTIAEYAEAMIAGATFPPVVVFYDAKTSTHWLADGFHRVSASLKSGRDRIACEVRHGSQRDAILFSVAANATHGLRRTTADKRRAVELLLGDVKWSKKSDRWVAEVCGVGHPFVAKLRPQLESDSSSSRPRLGKDGKARKLPKARPATTEPTAAALTFAMAAADEASALDDLQNDVDRHAAAWSWAPERFIAALEALAKKARGHFSAALKEVANV